MGQVLESFDDGLEGVSELGEGCGSRSDHQRRDDASP